MAKIPFGPNYDEMLDPGLIDKADAALAARRGVALEISGRKGHSFTNGYVLKIARLTGAQLVFDSDAHAAGDLPEPQQSEGLSEMVAHDLPGPKVKGEE